MPEVSPSDLREYETLHQEINNRTTISYTLVALDLAALGTGISVAGKSRIVLVALASISSLLWLYWTDHAGQVNRIAAYIAIHLAPRISVDEGRPVLQWEGFLRRINAGGQSARLVLFGPGGEGSDTVVPPRVISSDWYTTLLFGGSPPVLLALYAASSTKKSGLGMAASYLALIAGIALWVYALISYRRMRGAIANIATAILDASDRITRASAKLSPGATQAKAAARSTR